MFLNIPGQHPPIYRGIPLSETDTLWGTAAERPAANHQLIGLKYFATDTNGGTMYQCQIEPGSSPSWVQIAANVNLTPTSTASQTAVTVPATSSSTGITGQFAYDVNYFYFCVAANTWIRCAVTGGW